MKKINTSYVVDPSILQPFTTKSLDFLQNGNKEMIEALCRNIISFQDYSYNTTTPYLIGNINTPFPSDGVVFFNGELYIMTENTAGLTYATIDTTPDSVADPLLFTDSITRAVHNNRYLSYTNTLAGSLFAVSDIVSTTKRTNISISGYLNGWVANTSPISNPIYTKTFRRVKLSGIVSLSGSISGKQNIFTLPVGYRPSEIRVFPCWISDSGPAKVGILSVDTTGIVSILTSSFSGTTTNLVCFDSAIFDV